MGEEIRSHRPPLLFVFCGVNLGPKGMPIFLHSWLHAGKHEFLTLAHLPWYPELLEPLGVFLFMPKLVLVPFQNRHPRSLSAMLITFPGTVVKCLQEATSGRRDGCRLAPTVVRIQLILIWKAWRPAAPWQQEGECRWGSFPPHMSTQQEVEVGQEVTPGCRL